VYSEPVALASFKAFVFVAHGILSSLADEERTEYQIEAAASIIASMYLDHNGWYEATMGAQSPRVSDKPSILAPAVDTSDQ
jgi:hypothetical protein